jgi:vitamin B12 transporter
LTFNTITFWERAKSIWILYESDTYASNYVNIVGRNNAKGVKLWLLILFECVEG